MLRVVVVEKALKKMDFLSNLHSLPYKPLIYSFLASLLFSLS